jgi:hypothetical protein
MQDNFARALSCIAVSHVADELTMTALGIQPFLGALTFAAGVAFALAGMAFGVYAVAKVFTRGRGGR